MEESPNDFSHYLTHSVSEWRFDDIRLSGISRAKISRVEFLEPK